MTKDEREQLRRVLAVINAPINRASDDVAVAILAVGSIDAPDEVLGPIVTKGAQIARGLADLGDMLDALDDGEDRFVKFLRARDKNEAEIVKALRAAGASVTALTPSGKKEDRGTPDLLCGYMRATLLLEVKPPLGPKGGSKHAAGGKSRVGQGGDGVLTEGQIEWWGAWRGMAPTIVRNVEEALGCLRVIRDAIAAGAHITVEPFTPPGVPNPSEPGAST